MRVTRDVVFDLLPAYFAGELSADSRALVDDYSATDPEFARMATRFDTLLRERTVPVDAAEASRRERAAFDAARDAAELPQKTRAASLMWGFASLFGFGMAMLTPNPRLGYGHPGILIGACFGLTAVVVFLLSFRIKPDSWWRCVAGLDEQSLKPFRRRPRGAART